MKFSVVIPTYNREEDLKKCLNSILHQTVLPSEIIIIDDGNLLEIFIQNWEINFSHKKINFIYYKKNHKIERRGLSESKNKALDLVKNELFFILDDDTFLENYFFETIIQIWETKAGDNCLIGVGGIIKNHRKKFILEKYFYIFFGIYSKYSWDVNKVCFQIWDEDIKEQSFGYYAHGGVCSYNLDKVKKLKFSTFSGGRTALEDVDFCIRAKKMGYHFVIEPKAQLYHYPSLISREGKFLMGYKEGCNRKIIFKSIYEKPNIFLWFWFFWANLGWTLRQFLVGNFGKGLGMTKGFLK